MSRLDNVVVIGGAGFIGRALTSILRENQIPVTVVSRSAGGLKGQDGIRYVSGQVADASRMMEVIEGATVVYDLSMSAGVRWEDFERDYIGGARNVGRACLQHGVRRLIYTSSISALYLGKRGKQDESAGADSQPLKRGFYGRGKIEAERALLELHAKEQLPVVIFRPGAVVGTGGFLVHGALGERVAETSILGWGSGNTPLPWVLVGDVASALYLAKDAPGIDGMSFNLAGDVRPTALEYVELIRQRTRRNFRFYPRGILMLSLAERLRWAVKALARKPDNVCGSYRESQSMTMVADLDCSQAKRMLAWKPVADREEFLRQAIDSHIKPLPAGDLRLTGTTA